MCIKFYQTVYSSILFTIKKRDGSLWVDHLSKEDYTTTIQVIITGLLLKYVFTP